MIAHTPGLAITWIHGRPFLLSTNPPAPITPTNTAWVVDRCTCATERHSKTFGQHTPKRVRDRATQSVGKQWEFSFPNGFGASVINDGYGAEQGLYEVAIFGPNGHITYDTPLTDDVLGYLTVEEVVATLDRVAALSAADVEAEITRRANAERDARIDELRVELARLESEVTQ